jgi:preprotein translocase subunit SecB
MNPNVPTLSPLQLKSHWFPVVNVRATPNGKPSGQISATQEIGFMQIPDQPNHWNLQLVIKFGSADPSNPFFYEIEIHAFGIVELIGEIDPEKREPIVVINGLGILYGACREMVMNITARSIYSPCSIPSLNFTEVIKQAQQDQIEQQKSQLPGIEKSAPAPAV